MIGIVGGGLTGLALAHRLARLGVEHLVFEASDRPGGVTWSIEAEDRLLELGPQRTRLTPPVAELLTDLALEPELLLVPPDLPLFVYRNRRLGEVPLSLRSFVRTGLLSPRGKLRLLLEPLTGAPGRGETVADCLSRKLGREAYEAFFGPLYGGLYASDPGEMLVDLSLRHVLDEMGVGRSLLLAALWRGGVLGRHTPACSFRGGMRVLPETLSAKNRQRILCGAGVRAVRTRDGGGYTLVTDRGDVGVGTVVLTVPAPAAASLLGELDADLAGRLASLRYNPLAVVHLLVDASEPGTGTGKLRGYGYQVASGEGLETRGVTWNDSLFGGQHGRAGVFTAYLGGMGNPGLVEETDDRLGALAADEFRRVTGAPARPVQVHRTRVPSWDRTFAAMVPVRLPPGLHLEAAYTGRPGIPGRIARTRRLAEALAGATSNPRLPSETEPAAQGGLRGRRGRGGRPPRTETGGSTPGSGTRSRTPRGVRLRGPGHLRRGNGHAGARNGLDEHVRGSGSGADRTLSLPRRPPRESPGPRG